ncbi:MAG: hypothetical protein JNL83_13415 [Myxococcales bacterium]|nr:hypothetical protein [Myxococcales bacterium]
MPSRLSSLLVRDGLVGVKRMEKAFQRQVIYGGALDTILLEMNLVPEERLTQYLALASGLPPAERDEGQEISPEAVKLISREMAEQYRAVPLALSGETVRILVCSPLEIERLEDLADQLDRPLQPLISPEYRWHLVFARAYELDAPARYTTLARALDVDASTTPVGRSKSVIVDASAAPGVVVSGDITEKTPALSDQTTRMDTPPGRVDNAAPTMPMTAPPASSAAPDLPSLTDSGREKRNTLLGVRAPRQTDPGLPVLKKQPSQPIAKTIGTPPKREIAEIPSLVMDVAPPVVSFVTPQVSPSAGVPKAISDSGRTRRPSDRSRAMKRPSTAPIDTHGRDAPLPVVAARELLAHAEDRDTVFLTLLRAARLRARWAGLLTVQGGAAIGRVAIAEPGLDVAAVNTVLIPLDSVSPWRAVVSSHQPHIGPIVSGDPGIDAMALRLGGTMPPSALLMPVVLRDRVVAIVVAHRVHSDLRLADVTELLPMANTASEALGRLIVKSKSAGYRAPERSTGVVEIDADALDTRKVTKAAKAVKADGAWAAPAPVKAPALPEEPVEVSITADPPRPIATLIDEIENAREGHAEEALSEAVERAPEALGELMKRFPGKLRVDRFAVTGRPLRAAQYGGLLELVIRMGSFASDLLIDKMAAAPRDVRFYATVCAMELRPRTAVFALAERLFDQDFGIRACAIEALAGYPVQDLGTALVRARRALHSSDAEVVAAAASALTELGDTEAVVDLIGAIERSDSAGTHARRALVALTAQDFGTSERKWRKWYDTARGRHRIEWLIEGLGHKEDAIREGAINDLRRLTGEYFGYHHDLPRKEREAAASRWADWWRDAGQRRFVVKDDERNRPTAQLPARREP